MYKLMPAIALAAICFVAGCGSGGEDDSPLTKAEYISQANQICVANEKARKAAIATWENETTKQAPASQSTHLDEGLKTVVAPLLQREAEELNDLQPPRKDKATTAQMIDSLSKVSRTLAKEGAKGIPRSGLSTFTHEASSYGLKSCTKF